MPFYVGNVMSKSTECRPRNGSVDTTFAAFQTGLYADRPEDIKVQPDGKILVFGNADVVNGVTQNNICRLNVDGTLDTSFNTGANPGSSGTIYSGAIQPDGKIVVVGAFTTLRGVTRNRIGRLNTDGSLDTSFNNSSQGTVGANNQIFSVALQPDGKILIGGWFTTTRGVTTNGLARLNTDGTLDTTFNNAADGTVGTRVGSFGADRIFKFLPLSDGNIIVGGEFSTIRGVTQNGLAKLTSTGTVDTSFNTQVGSTDTPGVTLGDINDMVLQDTGKIVLVGGFRTFRGASIGYGLARANADGSRDSSWPSTNGISAGDDIFSCVEQYDKKIVVTGYFTNIRNTTQNGVARINPDGTLDTTFNTGGTVGLYRTDGSGTIAYAYAVGIQDDCKILVGGWFSQARGVTTGNIARLM